MTDEWAEVSNCAWVHQALFVKSVLDAAGIEAAVPDEHTASLYAPVLGGVRVLVRVDDEDAARAVLAAAGEPKQPTTAELLQQLAKRLAEKGGVVAVFAGVDRAAIRDAVSAVAEQSGKSVTRVDLSAVLSKYIGETEKHLNRVFADAETSGAVVFFDEADALFGRENEADAADARLLEYLLTQAEAGRASIILAVADPSVLPARARERVDYLLAFGS